MVPQYQALKNPYFNLILFARTTLLLLFYFQSIKSSAQYDRCISEGPGSSLSMRSLEDNDSLLTIPLVVHIIYQNEEQNVNDENVMSQIQRLNEDFRRLNVDTTSTPEAFRSVAADTKIEFCLSSTNSLSVGTMGITRTLTFVDEIGLTNRYRQAHLGGHDAWDQREYLNVWVCEIAEDGSIAGFSETASQNPSPSEGVVIDYRFFGLSPPAQPPFAGGRTLTHEIGHWLGLAHIWGDQAGCDSDDEIGDTPIQFDRYRDCPTYPQESCGSEDMFMNFMDLTDDACMNLFTWGQKERMRNVILDFKKEMLSASKCEDMITSSVSYRHTRDFQLFPNPTHGIITIGNGTLSGNERIYLRNLTGELMSFKQNNEHVDISALPAGLYILSIENHQQKISFKLVKNR